MKKEYSRLFGSDKNQNFDQSDEMEEVQTFPEKLEDELELFIKSMASKKAPISLGQ